MELKDITGQRFGKLTVIERAETKYIGKQAITMWRCKCDCGNEVIRTSQQIRNGVFPSCGCYKKAMTSERKLLDLTGKRFGRLVVLERAENAKSGLVRWKCKCDCGNECVVIANNLRRNHTVSCGCVREITRIENKKIHGKSHTRLYCVWEKMKARCYCETNPSYKRYGGRGITMCDEWKNDPVSFMNWALDHGYDSNAKYGECTVDRIDNNKGYCPENCRLVTNKEQQNNKRTNVTAEYNGETHTMAEWSEILNIPYGVVRNAIKSGRGISYLLNDYVPRK